ncbi:phosphoglycolate phosphatase [Klebsiella sp. WP4-W18-ESBL-05]|uniref:phosphoglycolate phosphatase n=1 Tax=Klebsiella sp. WP4-W18-ESBL-05 TaxID=2675713 RepID=UPI0015DC696E|nr:phosphoglycolate phosphatase [Klebsiella sp. WP4-W18-ESBL-05]BBR58922.1 hypothetical protein WP4W18E05_22900 [Klebsiella sp. WP4-W18-ESBL-05]
MDSWADTDKTYPGLDNAEIPNREEPSQELQATGFAPTYIDEQGNLVLGDGMTAQAMNFILHDLYAKYKALLARANA